MKKVFLFLLMVIPVVTFLLFPGVNVASAKDKIVIGAAISLSGPYAAGAEITQVPNYKMWVEEVNAQGGIFVKQFKKKLPVELIIYDDKSDLGTAVKLVEQLIMKDKVDFLLPPWGTAMHFAVAPVANKHGYPLIGTTCASEKLREVIHKMPYFFGTLGMPREKGAALADLLEDLKVKTAAIIFVGDGYGIEWAGKVAPALGVKGIDIPILKSYPPGVSDLSPLLKTVKAANVDAVLGMSYPGDTFLITDQAKVIGLNPKVFYLGIGVAFPAYRDKFGASKIEGMMGEGAWNKKSPFPGAKEYFDRHVKRWNKEPDRAGSANVFASLQVLQQAIEKVGSLDRKKIRDVIATATFTTVAGPYKFVDGFNIQSPGEIGQWQNGEFEVVAAKEKRTAQPIFPKPPWPEEKK
jgi:branched-chain amino acid transport system substrate-binding protein